MENELSYGRDELALKHKGKLLPENVDFKNILQTKNGIRKIEIELAVKEAKF